MLDGPNCSASVPQLLSWPRQLVQLNAVPTHALEHCRTCLLTA